MFMAKFWYISVLIVNKYLMHHLKSSYMVSNESLRKDEQIMSQLFHYNYYDGSGNKIIPHLNYPHNLATFTLPKNNKYATVGFI